MKRLFFFILFLLSANLAFADVVTRNPTGDEAESGTWSGATSTTRWTLVDDHPDTVCDAGDRILAGTAASEKTFTFTAFSIPAGSTITNVQVLYYDGKTGSAGVVARARLKVSGSYFANTTTHNTTNGGCITRTDTWTQNPNTTANWTVTDINTNLQAFGIGCSDCSPTTYFGSVQLSVTYTPPAGGCYLPMLGVGC